MGSKGCGRGLEGWGSCTQTHTNLRELEVLEVIVQIGWRERLQHLPQLCAQIQPDTAAHVSEGLGKCRERGRAQRERGVVRVCREEIPVSHLRRDPGQSPQKRSPSVTSPRVFMHVRMYLCIPTHARTHTRLLL